MSTGFIYDQSFWANQIERYLFGRLDSEWVPMQLSDPNKLADLLSALMQSTGEDIVWLSRLYHISRNEGAWDYILEELPDYINSLGWSLNRQTNASDHIRGRINWPQTFLQRFVGGNKFLYVTEDPLKSFDTPENRLLVFYLMQFANTSIPKGWKEKGTNYRVGDKLIAIIHESKRLLKHSCLRSVNHPSEVTNIMIQSAQRHKRQVYSRLADLWLEYEKTVYKPKLQALKELLSKGWIIPKIDSNTDDLFELYVLISTIRAVEKICRKFYPNIQVCHNVIRPDGSKVVTRLYDCSVTIDIAFDRSPVALLELKEVSSAYRNIIDLYEGIDGNSRRPDVLVRMKFTDGRDIRMVVEAKNTSSDSAYANDSIYKALGYLKDYHQLWDDSQKPKIVLALPYGIRPKLSIGSDWLHNDICIISGDLENKILQVIEHLLVVIDS